MKFGSQVAEVYKFVDGGRYLLYSPGHDLFLFCDITKINGIDWSNNLSKKEKLIRELNDKNEKLEGNTNTMKSRMPAEIKTLLDDDYKKIEDLDFLQNLTNIDVQANILKTMLNTDFN